MLRFKLDDLPPHLRVQAERQCAPARATTALPPLPASVAGTRPAASAKASGRGRAVRPPITMTRRNEQSSAERKFNAEFLDGKGKFEAVTLHLPGGSKYTGDFLVPQMTAEPTVRGLPVICEVKGSYRLKSHARAATAFKTACAVYPEFVFCWAEQEPGGGNRWKVSFFHDGQPLGPCVAGEPREIRTAFPAVRQEIA